MDSLLRQLKNIIIDNIRYENWFINILIIRECWCIDMKIDLNIREEVTQKKNQIQCTNNFLWLLTSRI